MKIHLNPQLSAALRAKINEHHNFSYEKTADFSFPKSKGKVHAQAYNCICATLDRIDDLVTHCNNIKIDSQFGLCDFFNYTQSLIECIKVLGDIYDVPALYKKPNEHDISIFNQPGKDNNGNDEKYFTYLRSLCSVHPVETSRHKEYQGDEAEWCPYITRSKSSPLALLSNRQPELKNADFFATVYRNDEKYSKIVPIRISELIAYVERRYQHIQTIINAVDNYNQTLISNFKSKSIPASDDFTDYITYLENLQKEIVERCGQPNNRKVREWIAVFKAHFKNDEMQRKLVDYQESFKQGIATIHDSLQEMNVDSYCEVEPITYKTDFIPNGYALEKLHYLENDFWGMEEADAYKLVESGGTPYINERIDQMLDIIFFARQNGATMEDLSDIAREIDAQYHTTNSEWARIQLKIIEPYFDNVIEFDYHLNDWYLHLQIEIAFWIISQRR